MATQFTQLAREGTRYLSSAERERFQTRGFLHPRSLCSTREMLRLRERHEAYEASVGGALPGKVRHKAHLLFTWLDELIRHPAILDAVESLLGPDLLCWTSNYFIKEPGDGKYVGWHQDATYFGLSEPRSCTAWVALSEADVGNGCMRIWPGSHRSALAHVDTFDRANVLSRGQQLAEPVIESEVVPIELQAGEFSLHHLMAAHYSPPNQSDRRRIGLAIRYIPTDIRQLNAPRDTAVLVRGRDDYGHFELLDGPDADLSPRAVQRHRRALKLSQRFLYAGTRLAAKAKDAEQGR